MDLVPMLRSDLAPTRRTVAAWAKRLVDECRERLAILLPLNPPESEFLRRLNDKGEIAAELLTATPAMQTILREHPGLRWKALNVRKHRGLDSTLHNDDDV
jgi:hypothetical protein